MQHNPADGVVQGLTGSKDLPTSSANLFISNYMRLIHRHRSHASVEAVLYKQFTSGRTDGHFLVPQMYKDVIGDWGR